MGCGRSIRGAGGNGPRYTSTIDCGGYGTLLEELRGACSPEPLSHSRPFRHSFCNSSADCLADRRQYSGEPPRGFGLQSDNVSVYRGRLAHRGGMDTWIVDRSCYGAGIGANACQGNVAGTQINRCRGILGTKCRLAGCRPVVPQRVCAISGGGHALGFGGRIGGGQLVCFSGFGISAYAEIGSAKKKAANSGRCSFA